jgi:hypothetical protein
MRTKSILLVCLFLGLGMIRLFAQGSENRSYPSRIDNASGGVFPVFCNGDDFDLLYVTGDLHLVDRFKNDTWLELVSVKWEGKSVLTGETFRGLEHDKAIIDSFDPNIGILAAHGTWCANLIGDKGSHYQITVNCTWTIENGYSFTLLKANCH